MEELARRNGVHANTIRLWRSKYAGMSASDLSRLKELEAKNAQMQRIIARQTVKFDAIEQIMRKTLGAVPASRSREGLARVRLSQREACKSVHARRRSSSETAILKAQRDAWVAMRLTQVAQAHADHGCRRLYYDYERDAVDGDEYMNYKAFRRIYRLAGLQMGRRRRRGRAKIVRGRSLRRATKPFEGWTLDFIQDRLFNGRSFRGLTMMDECTRVDLALELDYSFPSKCEVVRLPWTLSAWREGSTNGQKTSPVLPRGLSA